MIKTEWSNHRKQWFAYDTDDILTHRTGVSEANAISRLKNMTEKSPGFKMSLAHMEMLKAAVTPDMMSLKKK